MKNRIISFVADGRFTTKPGGDEVAEELGPRILVLPKVFLESGDVLHVQLFGALRSVGDVVVVDLGVRTAQNLANERSA
jgi:predicted RecB family endonuclease